MYASINHHARYLFFSNLSQQAFFTTSNSWTYQAEIAHINKKCIHQNSDAIIIQIKKLLSFPWVKLIIDIKKAIAQIICQRGLIL